MNTKGPKSTLINVEFLSKSRAKKEKITVVIDSNL